MKLTIYKQLTNFMLIALIAATPVLLNSCNNDDDDDKNNPQQNDDGNNNNAKGEGSYTITGAEDISFTDSTVFYDTTNYAIFGLSDTMNHTMIIAARNVNSGDTSTFQVYIADKNGNSRIGKGSYNNQPFDSAFSVGAAALVTINDKLYATANYREKTEGTVIINSRTDNTVKGEIKDVKLLGGFGNNPSATITLNGSFNAEAIR